MLHILFSLLFLAPASQNLVSGRLFKSPPLAHEVVRLLQNNVLRAFAAEDRAGSGRFVAALYVGDQLLTIDTFRPNPAAVRKRIASGLYRDVYLELQKTAVPGTFFVQDYGADGLLTIAAGTDAVDLVHGVRGTALRFNGDPKGQQLTVAEYNRHFSVADDRYAHMLSVLKEALEK
jgi:hypothetical protein